MSSTFCPLPWNTLSVQTHGGVRVCAASQSMTDRGLLATNVPLSFADTLNHPTLKKLRKDLLAGVETPEVCGRCIQEEKHGLTSRRVLEREILKSLCQEEAQAHTNEDGSLPDQTPWRLRLDLRLGNKCNLSCVMCGPSSSTAWYQEWYERKFHGFQDGVQRRQLVRDIAGIVRLKNPQGYDWFNSYSIQKIVDKPIEAIHFSGGEPLLYPDHLQLLESLVREGRSKAIALDYNSNWTVIPPSLFSLWSQFQSVKVGVSVDAYGRLNDFIRYPSQFEVLERNLQHLNDHTSERLSYWLTTTLSALNIHRFDELIFWLAKSELKRSAGLVFHLLRKPESMSVGVLPWPERHKILLRLERVRKELSDWAPFHALLAKEWPGLLQTLEEKTESSGLENLRQEIRAIEAYRGLKLKDCNPELEEVLR